MVFEVASKKKKKTTTAKIYFSNKIQVYEYTLSVTILRENNIKIIPAVTYQVYTY